MRCDDVARELAVPTDGTDRAALADHLASCGACATRAASEARLDRVWQITRPEPRAGFEAVWASVTGRLASSSEPVILPMGTTSPRRRWGSRVLVGTLLAQAAALLALGVYLVRPSPGVPPSASLPNEPTGTVQVVEFELDAGQTLFLELDAHNDRVVCRPKFVETDDLVAFDGEESPDPYAEASQANLLVFNFVEGME